MKFIIDTFSDVIGACTVTHNVLVGCRFLRKNDKKGQTVHRIRPLVEYAAFFGTLVREYINQIEMSQYRVVRYIFNDYNLRRNWQGDESQCDTSRATNQNAG